MEIVKSFKDDEILIQACKKLCSEYVFDFSSPDISMDEGIVHLYNADFKRLVDLAEIGKNVMQGINCEVNENKRKKDAEYGEKQPEPHFKYNVEGGYDCSKCLCYTCPNYEGNLAEACAESCCNTICHDNFYVDSCPAYNDGRNF